MKRPTWARILDQVHASRTRPVVVELLNRRAARTIAGLARMAAAEAPWSVIVGYEGNADLVAWQVQQLVRELGAGRSLDARVGAPAQPLWQALVEWPARRGDQPFVNASLLPSEIARFVGRASAGDHELRSHAGNGIVNLGIGAQAGVSDMRDMLMVLKQSVKSVVVSRCPSEWKSTVNVWGAPPADAWLMRRIKQRFDPHGVFNPGRFVDGI